MYFTGALFGSCAFSWEPKNARTKDPLYDIGSVHLQNDSILILILKKSFCILVTIVWVVLGVWLSLHMPSLSYNFAQQSGWSLARDAREAPGYLVEKCARVCPSCLSAMRMHFSPAACLAVRVHHAQATWADIARDTRKALG